MFKDAHTKQNLVGLQPWHNTGANIRRAYVGDGNLVQAGFVITSGWPLE
jgi:hypothetical protein|tara:strand:+ start:631 stop:777 length:147 start_codon:yes stop_codon:yes gene_type:complete